MTCNRWQSAVKSYQVVIAALLSPYFLFSAPCWNCSNYCLSRAVGSPFLLWVCVSAEKDFFGVLHSSPWDPFAVSACPAAISSCCSRPCARWIRVIRKLSDTPRTAAFPPPILLKTMISAGWYWVGWWWSDCLCGKNCCLCSVCFCGRWSDVSLDFHSTLLIAGLRRWGLVKCGSWECAWLRSLFIC